MFQAGLPVNKQVLSGRIWYDDLRIRGVTFIVVLNVVLYEIELKCYWIYVFYNGYIIYYTV